MYPLSIMQSTKKFLKDLFRRNENVFLFSQDEEQKVLNQLLSHISKYHSVLWVQNGAETILYKKNGEIGFTDISGNQELITTIQMRDDLDYMVLDGLDENDYFSLLSSIYNERTGVIAVFESTTSEGFKAYLDFQVENDVQTNYPHLNKSYFLSKTLPIVLEANQQFEGFKEFKLKDSGEIYAEEIYSKKEDLWVWTGYSPSYMFAQRVDVAELERLKYFNGDKELHTRLKEGLFAKLRNKAQAYYVPVVDQDSETSTLSYYGGFPLVAKGEAEPLCPCCKGELSLTLQLDLKNVPGAVQEVLGVKRGYLQVFSCEEDMGECTFGSKVEKPVRILEEGDLSVWKNPERVVSEKKEIVGWEEHFEKPTPKLLKENNITLTKEEKEFMKWYYEKTEEVTDKVGGIPIYNQSNPRLKCKESKKAMRFILQIESYFHSDNFNGRIYVYQSPVNEKALTYHWDCD